MPSPEETDFPLLTLAPPWPWRLRQHCLPSLEPQAVAPRDRRWEEWGEELVRAEHPDGWVVQVDWLPPRAPEGRFRLVVRRGDETVQRWEGRSLASLLVELRAALSSRAIPLPDSPGALLTALADPDRRSLLAALERSAPIGLIVGALDTSADPVITAALCDLAGRRADRAAVPPLLAQLDHPAAAVRSAAAEALGRIGDPSAGEAIFTRWILPDPALTVRRTLVVTLGALRHTPALPMLMTYLGSPDPSMRGNTAWSLGSMGDPRAIPALEDALSRERQSFPRKRMRAALAALHAAQPA